MRKFYITNLIYLVLLVATVLVGCTHTVTETPTDTAPSKLDPKPVGLVSSESSAPAESTEESKGETSSQIEIGSKLDPKKPTAPAKDEKPATSTVEKPNKTNKPSNNVPSKPQNNTASEGDQMLVVKHDIKAIEKAIAKYINQYRVAEGKPTATFLTGKAYQYAKLRAEQLTTNFRHDPQDEHDAAQQTKFGELSTTEDSYYDFETDEVVYTGEKITSYTRPGSEAIGWTEIASYFDNDRIGKILAKGCYDSKGHWRYVGHESNIYISVGVVMVGERVYCDVYVNNTNEYD